MMRPCNQAAVPLLEFTLNDVIGGESISPSNVDLPTLRAFLDEIEKLIKGNLGGASLSDSKVELRQGSLIVATLVSALIASDLSSDLSRLDATGDLDAIQPRRADVLELWQARATKSPTRAYSLSGLGRKRPLRISSTSLFQRGAENQWVSVEKYVTGKVIDAGGKNAPNIHLILLESGKGLKIDATEQQLAGERDNPLYKLLTLRVQGEQHLRTRDLRNLKLLEFHAPSGQADDGVLQNLWNKGREAWRSVPSATQWVETLRGNA